MIRSQITLLIKQRQSTVLTGVNLKEGEAGIEDNSFNGHLHLGSTQKPIMFDEMEEAHAVGVVNGLLTFVYLLI